MKGNPARIDKVLAHRELKELREHPKVKALAMDADLKMAFDRRDFGLLLANRAVLDLLKDREIRRLLSEVDYEEILRDVKGQSTGGREFH